MRRRITRLALLTTLALAVVGITQATGAGGANGDGFNPFVTEVDRHHTPSTVVFPKQNLPLRFFHDKHLAEGIGCTDCHAGVGESTRSSDNNLPEATVCADCHYVEDGKEADPPSECATCHLNYTGEYDGFDPHEEPSKVTKVPGVVVIPNPNLQFNHKVHIDRNIACESCHEKLDTIAVAAPVNAIPVMGKCLECHDGKEAPSDCSTCHLTRPDGRLVTDFPEGELKPHGFYRNDFHNEYFIQNHEQVARSDEGYCLNCHQRRDCVDCHNGIVKPTKIHPANWILIHNISARKNSLECASCHRAQSFCIDCHRRVGIVDLDATRSSSVKFHPNGWVNLDGTTPSANHHMFQAQRNIRACVGCHEERTCLKCHSARPTNPYGVTSYNSQLHNGATTPVSPHPPGFSKRCGKMMDLNSGVCMKCHLPQDPKLLSCQ